MAFVVRRNSSKLSFQFYGFSEDNPTSSTNFKIWKSVTDRRLKKDPLVSKTFQKMDFKLRKNICIFI